MADWASRLRDLLWDHPELVVAAVAIWVYSYDLYARVRGRRRARAGTCSRCGRHPATEDVDDFLRSARVCAGCGRSIIARYRIGFYLFVGMLIIVGATAVTLVVTDVQGGRGVPWHDLRGMVWRAIAGAFIALWIHARLRKGQRA